MFEPLIRQALERWSARLRNVRAELVEISTDLEPIATRTILKTDTPDPAFDVVRVAYAVRRVCGILLRVIDSMKVSN